ncbi:MAG TPA: DegQ family serine endoprotease [Lysobacter sp.]|nr:DegQ family serine endoprotease [Lysobacter sp.]
MPVPSLRALALVAATATATTLVMNPPQATAQTSPPAAPAPQLVAGLPDFTGLVQQVGPGVVNVEATIGGHATSAKTARRGAPDEDQIPEIFKRFFGPDFRMPGMPDGPQRPDDGPRGVSMGSGFIISADGYVLTNRHVVDGADSVTVKLTDQRELKAKVVGSDEQSDVALLKIDASGLPALRIGDSKQLKPGQWVVAIGSPFGLDHSVTAGIVSAVGRANRYANQQYVPFIQTDVAINQGNSGGPLLNTRGEVVGINSQIFSNSGGYMGVSFAIPIDIAMSVAKQLRTTGKVDRGMIGVRLQGITADIAKASGLPDTRGALISEVTAGSAGEKAGLRVGDVIRAVDGDAVRQSSDLPPIIGAMAPGTHVQLSVLRDGKTLQVPVTLSKLDDGELAAVQGGEPDSTSRASGGNPLGLIGEDLDADDRRQLGLKPGEGVGIVRVEGSGAREAGLQAGDVVLQVGRTSVGSVAALDRELGKVKDGQTVMLLVRRDGATQFVAVAAGGDDE